jgi:hypothetical protein
VVQRRSWARLSLIPELFWKLINFLQFLCAPSRTRAGSGSATHRATQP